MSTFEKFLESEPDFECIHIPCAKCRRDAGLIWKAALEWVKKIAEEINKSDLPISPLDLINDELEEL